MVIYNKLPVLAIPNSVTTIPNFIMTIPSHSTFTHLVFLSNLIIYPTGGASPYVPGVPGHTQFLGKIRVKAYMGTPSFFC